MATALSGRQAPVVLEVVRRVVRRAHELDVGPLDQGAGAHVLALQLFPAQVPDLLGGVRAEDAVKAEVALELQMAPVVQGIADGAREDLRVLLKLLAVGGVAGDVLLLHAARAQQAPLVMVAAQPDLRDVGEAAVLVDLLRAQVAVVVQDGHVRGVVVVENARRGRLEQEVLVQKGHGSLLLW